MTKDEKSCETKPDNAEALWALRKLEYLIECYNTEPAFSSCEPELKTIRKALEGKG